MKSFPTSLAVLVGLTTATTKAAPDSALDGAKFGELHAELKPPADEEWRELPWQDSVLQARAVAVKKKKPVYMLVRSGNPLGCV